MVEIPLKDLTNLLHLMQYVQKSCLCERFKTKGFDYSQKHPYLGKCDGGQRWLTPAVMARGIEDVISEKTRSLIPKDND